VEEKSWNATTPTQRWSGRSVLIALDQSTSGLRSTAGSWKSLWAKAA
jgi:hypothetical protein